MAPELRTTTLVSPDPNCSPCSCPGVSIGQVSEMGGSSPLPPFSYTVVRGFSCRP